MRYLLYSLALLSCLALYACAGVEASVMDTAETLGTGKLSVSNTFTMGINFPEWQNIDPEDIFDGDTIHPIQYPELKYGLNPQVDISLRLGMHEDAQSAKVLLKKQISKQDKVSTAVVLGGGMAKIDSRFWDEDYDNYHGFEVLSAELHLLLTRQFWRLNYITVAARGSYHRFSTELKNSSWEVEDVYHAGMRLNLKHYMRPFYGMLELGFEAPLSIENTHQVFPWVGLRAGWDFEL